MDAEYIRDERPFVLCWGAHAPSRVTIGALADGDWGIVLKQS
jgi:hypothetical protein